MRTKKILIAALGLTTLAALAGCSSSAGTNASGSSTPSGAGKTLTVWAMQYDLSPATLKAVNSEFTKETGAKVDLQVQQWTGIETKLPTALATSTPPDVIDIGNTQVSSYASTGGLFDLTKYATSLAQGQTWLGGLVNPATINKHLYAVPSFAGDRAVIYNKKIWAAAGVTSTPKTYAELKTDLDKIKSANSSASFSAFYLPAENWIASMQWIWDAGGQIATQSSNGTWHGGFESANAQNGLKEFKSFQNAYSTKSSQLLDNLTPAQDTVFANGQASAILDTSGALASIKKANPSLTDADLGTFAMPGASGKTQTVMLAGSVWGVAAKSHNKDLAVAWIKIAASPKVQKNNVFGADGWIPNSEQGLSAVHSEVSPENVAFFTAAQRSAASPAAATWTTIQDEKSIGNFFGTIASGSQSPAAAAKTFDAHLNSVLNSK